MDMAVIFLYLFLSKKQKQNGIFWAKKQKKAKKILHFI